MLSGKKYLLVVKCNHTDLNANFWGKKEEYTNVLVSVSLIQQLPRHIVVFNNLHVVYSAAIDYAFSC